MPTFYNFTENNIVRSFDDVFVPANVFRDGNLWGWGNGIDGRLGNAATTDALTPVTTLAGGANWKQVSSGNFHTAAIKTDGTLWTWGSNSQAQLGNNGNTNTSTPITTFAGGTNWKQVSSGDSHTSAIKTDGTLWTWGNGSLVQLGNNGNTNTSTPITTFAGGTNWKQVSSGGYHTAAIKTDGTLWTWGRNSYGALGINNNTNSSTPVTTFAGGNNWNQVSSGNFHTAAIKTDGTLWSWGFGIQGQHGDTQIINRSTPVTTFAGGTNWKQVSCGRENTVAIKTDGTLWSWGRNYFNGDNNNALDKSTPVTTFAGGTNWKQVNSSFYNITAIKTDGTLWTWGQNNDGQLGNASISGSGTPITTFAGGTNWKQVSAGRSHTSAVTYIDSVI